MTDRQRKLKALAKLVVRRQAEVTEGDLAVYLEDVDAIPVEIVERACDAIGKAPRLEYETAYPPVGNLLKACQRALVDLERERIDRLIASATKALPPAVDDSPLTRPEAKAAWDDFRSRMNAVMRRRTS